MDFADSHNHLQRFADPRPIIEAMRAAGVTCCVVNATSPADWPQVASLADEFPGFATPAFGIHPWHAHRATPGWRDRLRELLAQFPAASVGECGLDRWIESPPLAVQAPVFEDQLAIAREAGRAVTIHCVSAWGALFESFDRSPPPPRLLLHAYGGSPETARRLVPMGAFFSFSGQVLHPSKAAAMETLRDIPHGRLLVETDAPDMLPPQDLVSHPLPDGQNHPANLGAIAAALAARLGLPAADFAALTLRNHHACFARQDMLDRDRRA